MKRNLGIVCATGFVIALMLLAGMPTGLAGAPAGEMAAQDMLGPVITYQGRLTDMDAPAHGSYDLIFGVWDAPAGGTLVAGPVERENVAVKNGIFVVDLDFGEVFNGEARFLEIGVRRGPSTGAYTTLSPRQTVRPAPYALALPGMRTENLDARAPNVIGGDLDNTVGAGVEGATIAGGFAHEARGNASTIPGGEGNRANGAYSLAAGRYAQAMHQGAFVWADSAGAPLQSAAVDQFLIRASGGMTLTTSAGVMLQMIPRQGSPSFAFGHHGNVLTAGAKGVVLGGGGESGSINRATDDFAMVAGGAGNQAGNNNASVSDAPYAAVGGGKGNRSTGRGAVVGGGEYNSATAQDATVAGGKENSASGQDSTIAGGRDNAATGEASTVAGGVDNGANAVYSAVGGGTLNVASGQSATVGGGNANTAGAGNATVAGGNGNTAGGTYASVGGGRGNDASGTHSTVAGGRDNAASGTEAMSPGGGGNRAEGDYSFAAGRQALASHAGSFVWADATELDFGSLADNDFSARATGGVRFVTAVDASGNPTAGISLPAGGSSWGTPSDRNLKEHIVPVDGREVLEQLAAMPISRWNYRTQDDSIQHIGPMSQDFQAAFGIGEDDLHIATVDADGVALAAGQALYALVEAQEAQIAALEARLEALEMEQNASSEPLAGWPAWILLGSVLVAGVVVRPGVFRGGRA